MKGTTNQGKGGVMDARLNFEWSGNKAKEFFSFIERCEQIPAKYQEWANREDADYEIVLEVTLKHKRKKRRKVNEYLEPTTEERIPEIPNPLRDLTED